MADITTLSAREIQTKLQNGAVLIDIRSPDEYRREHIEGAVCLSPAQLPSSTDAKIQQASCLVFHCKSGMRTQHAAAQLAQYCAENGKEGFIMQKGLDGWKTAGFQTRINKSQPLEMMRQVQIAAGLLILTGAVLGWLVSPLFYLLCAFVGCGLLLAGVTGFCGMARLLALMPWDKPA